MRPKGSQRLWDESQDVFPDNGGEKEMSRFERTTPVPDNGNHPEEENYHQVLPMGQEPFFDLSSRNLIFEDQTIWPSKDSSSH